MENIQKSGYTPSPNIGSNDPSSDISKKSPTRAETPKSSRGAAITDVKSPRVQQEAKIINNNNIRGVLSSRSSKSSDTPSSGKGTALKLPKALAGLPKLRISAEHEKDVPEDRDEVKNKALDSHREAKDKDSKLKEQPHLNPKEPDFDLLMLKSPRIMGAKPIAVGKQPAPKAQEQQSVKSPRPSPAELKLDLSKLKTPEQGSKSPPRPSPAELKLNLSTVRQHDYGVGEEKSVKQEEPIIIKNEDSEKEETKKEEGDVREPDFLKQFYSEQTVISESEKTDTEMELNEPGSNIIMVEAKEEAPQELSPAEVKAVKSIGEVFTSENTYATSLQALCSSNMIGNLAAMAKEPDKSVLEEFDKAVRHHSQQAANFANRLEHADKISQGGDLEGGREAILNAYASEYADYQKGATQCATLFEEVQTICKKLNNENPKEYATLQTNLNNASNSKKEIGSFLILPIQRLPRHEMLAGEMIKRTPEDSPHIGALGVLHEQTKAGSKAAEQSAGLAKQQRSILSTWTSPPQKFDKAGFEANIKKLKAMPSGPEKNLLKAQTRKMLLASPSNGKLAPDLMPHSPEGLMAADLMDIRVMMASHNVPTGPILKILDSMNQPGSIGNKILKGDKKLQAEFLATYDKIEQEQQVRLAAQANEPLPTFEEPLPPFPSADIPDNLPNNIKQSLRTPGGDAMKDFSFGFPINQRLATLENLGEEHAHLREPIQEQLQWLNNAMDVKTVKDGGSPLTLGSVDLKEVIDKKQTLLTRLSGENTQPHMREVLQNQLNTLNAALTLQKNSDNQLQQIRQTWTGNVSRGKAKELLSQHLDIIERQADSGVQMFTHPSGSTEALGTFIENRILKNPAAKQALDADPKLRARCQSLALTMMNKQYVADIQGAADMLQGTEGPRHEILDFIAEKTRGKIRDAEVTKLTNEEIDTLNEQETDAGLKELGILSECGGMDLNDKKAMLKVHKEASLDKGGGYAGLVVVMEKGQPRMDEILVNHNVNEMREWAGGVQSLTENPSRAIADNERLNLSVEQRLEARQALEAGQLDDSSRIAKSAINPLFKDSKARVVDGFKGAISRCVSILVEDEQISKAEADDIKKRYAAATPSEGEKNWTAVGNILHELASKLPH